MNSCLYECTIMHHRLQPKRHRFVYKIFMFYIDLDEIDEISRQFLLISRNKFNLFSFQDSDHLQPTGKAVKENIIDYLRTNGIDLEGGRILLLTNLRTLGHVFNPVSFFFCFDKLGNPACAVVEVENTYHERKPYFLGKHHLQEKTFHLETTKYFYVSPFVDMDSSFEFHLNLPEERLNVQINDSRDGKQFLLSSLSGRKRGLSGSRLFWYALRFPFITLQIISAIHWQALLLYLKGIPYHRKLEKLDLQRGMYRGRNSQ